MKNNQLMLEHVFTVKMIAQKLAARLPANIELDDLVSAGLIGLMQAMEKFDASKGFQFKTFAEFRIRGAMLDELRSQDWAPKGMRQKAKEFIRTAEAIAQEKGRAATDEEVREKLHLNREKFAKLAHNVRTLEAMKACEYAEKKNAESHLVLIEQIPDPCVSPFLPSEDDNLRESMAEALHQLPEKESFILTHYYFHELSLKEIGIKLSISESRVSQLHTKALATLRSLLVEEKMAA